jgi:hypothetical protein
MSLKMISWIKIHSPALAYQLARLRRRHSEKLADFKLKGWARMLVRSVWSKFATFTIFIPKYQKWIIKEK